MNTAKIACVVLPTYNEAENVKIIIPQIFEQAKKIKTHQLHVLIVDDSSPDGTAGVVKELQKDFPNLHLITGEKRGLGEAYKRGMAYATDKLGSEFLFQMDADLQHDPAMLPLFATLYNYGFTFVIGSRFAPGGEIVNFTLYRKMISLVGNFLIRFLGGLPRLHDFTSGYRCIQAALIKKCNMENLATRGYSFQTSLAFELLRNGAKVLEIPIKFRERASGESKLAFRDQFEFIINLARIRFGRYFEFVRYLFIGFSGLLVNLGLYLALTRFFSFIPEIAALISIESSIISNFLLNNLWNIKKSRTGRHWLPRLIAFHKIVIPGAIINYLVFVSLLSSGMFDLLALGLGIALNIFINYFANAYVTWRASRQS